jgi:hypothetical protein
LSPTHQAVVLISSCVYLYISHRMISQGLTS